MQEGRYSHHFTLNVYVSYTRKPIETRRLKAVRVREMGRARGNLGENTEREKERGSPRFRSSR